MKISVYIATSLDGFIARKDGSLDWLPGADGESAGDEDYGYHDFIATVDMLVMGRNTYELVLSFGGNWPYGDKPITILSNTLTELAPHVPDCVQLMSGTPNEIVTNLKTQGVQHIYIDGGKTIQAFLAAGLVDQLILTRVPVLIGSGIPLFSDLPNDIHLKHVTTQSFASGFVQSRYEASRNSSMLNKSVEEQ